MNVIGIDFTSAPSRRKPIVAQHLELKDRVLRATSVECWTTFAGFEDVIHRSGRWIAGVDFPFGLPRKFIENIGWQQSWVGYVGQVERLQRKRFRDNLTRYREGRTAGDKEHRRATDVAAKSISPQKLHGVPVALMFFEGAPRLLASPASLPLLKDGDSERVIVESYPGVLARALIGRRSYKNDARMKQTSALYEARKDMLRLLILMAPRVYGFSVQASDETCEDPSGDRLDALLCGVQAAWAWMQKEQNFGLPLDVDPLEGWIADPHVRA